MAGRIRTIKPEILEDEKSASLSSDAYRLWTGMWIIGDDHGRVRAAPGWLKSQVFWHPSHAAVNVERLLIELEQAGLVRRYQVRGQWYAETVNWRKHQKVDHPSSPRVPVPEEADQEPSREASRDLASDSPVLAPDPDLRPPISDPDLLKEKQRAIHVARTTGVPVPPAAVGWAWDELWTNVLKKTPGDTHLWSSLKERIEKAALLLSPPKRAADYARELFSAMPAFVRWAQSQPWDSKPTISVRAFASNFERLEQWVADGGPPKESNRRGPDQVMHPNSVSALEKLF